MSILIGGGGGFIGYHVVKKLVEKGELVVVFDLMPNVDLFKRFGEKVKVVRGDATHLSDILHAVKENGVEDIFHLIALLADVSQEKPLLALKVNVESTVNFLEAVRIMNLRRIVFASSVAVYDPNEKPPVKESAPLRPISVYGATKVLSEFYGLHYHHLFGVDFRALRFTTIYGLGKSGGSTGVCSLMIEKSALGQPTKGDVGDAVTDWLYIKDAVSSLILAREIDDPKGRIYNIGGTSHRVKEIAEIVRRFIPNADIQLESKKVFPWPPAYDYSKAGEELGYSPAFSIEEGIQDFIRETRTKYQQDIS